MLSYACLAIHLEGETFLHFAKMEITSSSLHNFEIYYDETMGGKVRKTYGLLDLGWEKLCNY